MKKFIGYYRESTGKQGKNGLGMDGQKSAVDEYVSSRGVLIASFTEVETGTRKKKRVEIYKAIELAKEEKAILVVAKLDRLARDIEFTSALQNTDLDFICCDMPDATPFTINILSAVAQNEADLISSRTKAALNEKKKRIAKGDYKNKDGSKMQPDNDGNYRLGNPNGFIEKYQILGAEQSRINAEKDITNNQAKEIICDKRKQGLTFQAIADHLNKFKHKTRYGNEFNPIQVQRLFKRCISPNEKKLNKYLK